jgi:hypothetical protein
MLHRFNFANFSKGPPRDQRESPEGRGTIAFHFPTSSCGHPRVAVSFLGPQRKAFLSQTPGKRKGEVCTLGLP